MLYSLQQGLYAREPAPPSDISKAATTACDQAITKHLGRWFGRVPTPIEKSEMIRRARGNPARIPAVFDEVLKEASNIGYFGGTPPTLALPSNSPTSSAAGASSSNGLPLGLALTTEDIFPDLLQLRTADQIAPRGGSAADSSNRAWAASGRGDVDAPAGPILVFDSTPTQTAGDQLLLDCRRVAASLGIQDVNGLAKAIQAAVTSRRKKV